MKKFTHLWQVTLSLFLLCSTISGGSFALANGAADLTGKKPLLWQITGKVTSAVTQEALPGVTIYMKGTTVGTSTDINGEYTLMVPESPDTLVFSFIGMQKQERNFTGPGIINVALAEDTRSLNEVVVTGYTTQNRRDITGAVSVVKPDELLATPAGNVQQQMQGRVAGVVTSGTGVPGAGAKVRIRGFGTFGNNDPLYVIDGVPTENVNNINPQDIESMQVLKDASAASIYGARAANGVIIITTRKGKTGATTIGLDSYYGVQQAPQGPDMLNPTELGQLLWESMANAGQTPTHPQYGSGAQPRFPDYIIAGPVSGVMEGHPETNPDLYNIDFNSPLHRIVQFNPEGTDWWNELFRTAPMQSHQLNASGGTEAASYAVGLNYFDQDGLMPHTGYKRYSLRVNTQFTAKKRLRIGENAQFSYNEFRGTDTGVGGGESFVIQAIRTYPFIPVNDIMGNWAGTAGQGAGTAPSVIAELNRSKDNTRTGFRMFGNVFAELDLVEGLTARTSFGVDYETRYQQSYGFRTYERAENPGANSYQEQNDFNLGWTWTNTLVYKKRFADLHDITLLTGTEAIRNTGRGVGGRRINFFSDDPLFRVLDRGSPVGQNNFSYGFGETLSSVFGRVDYTFNEKYLLNATLRRDGSSKFGQKNKYGVFPAASVGWRISGEEFMQGVTFVDDLKFRAGWGQMGNQQTVNAANAYSFYRSTPSNSSYAIDGSNTAVTPGFDLDRLGSPGTRWEATTTTNIGIDANLFNGRLEIALDWYNRTTADLLVGARAPGTLGHANLPSVNIGDIRNRGVDLMMATRGNIGGSGLKYDVALTFGAYRNMVLKVGENIGDIIPGTVMRNVEITRSTAGQPISSFYGYIIDGFYNTQAEVEAGPDQPQKRVGSWRIKDVNDDGVINSEDKEYIGSPHPDFNAGLNFTLAYRNFDFNIFLYSVVGNEIYNNTRWWTDFNSFQGNRSQRMLEQSFRIGADNSNAVLPILDATDTYSNSIANTYLIEDGSYLRARTIQLGYNIPSSLGSRIGLNNLRVYLQGQNVFTITNYSGVDPDVTTLGPETGMGIDMGWYPNPKVFMLGINLGF